MSIVYGVGGSSVGGGGGGVDPATLDAAIQVALAPIRAVSASQAAAITELTVALGQPSTSLPGAPFASMMLDDYVLDCFFTSAAQTLFRLSETPGSDRTLTVGADEHTTFTLDGKNLTWTGATLAANQVAAFLYLPAESV